MAHQECSQKFLQKKGGKNIPFLDENIPCLEGRRGGAVARVVLRKGFRNPRGTWVRVWRVGVRVGNV